MGRQIIGKEKGGDPKQKKHVENGRWDQEDNGDNVWINCSAPAS